MKPAHLALIIAGNLALLIVGVAGGIWFATHYKVVPIQQAQAPSAQMLGAPLNDMPAPSAVPPAATQASPTAAAPAPATPMPGHKFKPGEELGYQLRAQVAGTGIETGQSSGITLDVDSKMKLVTESVDPLGNGTLRLTFDTFKATGNFMGEPIEIAQADGQTTWKMNGKTQVDTENGKGTQGIAPLEFLRQPVRMVVAPNGDVVNVMGGFGLEKMLPPVLPLESSMRGKNWNSDFSLPIPGVGVPVPARAQNVMKGYQMYQGRNCAVIEQTLSSAQDSGGGDLSQALGALGGLGGGMNLPMPKFKLTGQNTLYADADSGWLAHADINVDVAL